MLKDVPVRVEFVRFEYITALAKVSFPVRMILIQLILTFPAMLT